MRIVYRVRMTKSQHLAAKPWDSSLGPYINLGNSSKLILNGMVQHTSLIG